MSALIKRIYNSLPLRMVVPVVVVIIFVGIGLYVFVLRSVSKFADEQISHTLTGIASEIYDICDSNFTSLAQSGKMDDPKAVTIEKALTVGAIEDYIRRNNIGCRLIERDKGELLLYQIDPDFIEIISNHHFKGIASKLDFKGKTYYFQHITFRPWGWHADLVKDSASYAPLVAQVKLAYTITGILLFLGLVINLLLQERLLRRPLYRIISAVRRRRSPEYKGIYELEFLSNSISTMMQSLEERNKWIAYLYRIAITNRGEDFFVRVAEALSEALDLNVLIVKYQTQERAFQVVAFSLLDENMNETIASSRGLPIQQIVKTRESIIIPSDAYKQFPSAPSLYNYKAQTYSGIPILDRNDVVIGIMNLFGKQRELSEWDLGLIKTVCQVVADEFELLAKEKDRLKLESQLQQAQKMEAIGLLAGGVAHDLNNVLSGIVSYPELLLMELDDDSPLKEPIQAIQHSGQRAAEIVQDLLTLARRGVESKQIVNVNEIILDYIDSPEFERMAARNSNVLIETRLEEKLLNVAGSPTQLLKTVMNLVSNAAEAQPSGGRILISTRNQEVRWPIKGYEEIRPGNFVVLEIKDEGIGISKEDLPRIFEPFYTKKVMGTSGTGLGMAVVWGTIHDHQGFVDVNTREGVGTTFSLYFPVTEREPEAKRGVIPMEDYMGTNETVLVVDDVKEQRDIAAKILSKLNYTVKTAPCGEAAIEYMQKNQADLLILDMIMDPGIDGLETYKRILKLHPNQKAIIASGYSETDRVKAAQRLGAGEYIKKPYTLEKIGVAIKNTLLE